jgi:UDP-3-O-[3-hydroxymyristoyl] glucosamine N-acyltransferase
VSEGHAARPGASGVIVLTAAEIASAVGGRVVGDGSAAVRAVAPLDRAGVEDLSFLSGARYASLFEGSSAGVVLVPPGLEQAPGRARARVVVAKPHEALLALLPRFYRPPERVAGVHPTAVVGRGAKLGDDVAIGPYAVIGERAVLGSRVTVDAHGVVGEGVEIGDESRLFPMVTLYPGTRLGRRVLLHSGVRIGSDGFGYVFREGAHQKLPHVGRAVIEDDVEIGANSTVDRGSIDDTVIGAGTKIDNLVHVGHNVRIGRLCLLMAQVGISGSARIEDGCILAGQAGIAGHITIGKGARIAGQAGVFGDVPAGETWSGYPARPHREALRAQAATFKLPSLLRPLERLLAAQGVKERDA